jgi:hypothetical protein
MKVTQSMCGSQISCGCGRKTMVPRLSELRRNAGLSPSRISPADKLLALSLERELPLESDCMRCGGITQTFLGCLVECEQTYAKRISFFSYFLQCLLVPWFVVTLVKRDYDNPEVHGRELVLKTPLRLCLDCWSTQKMDRLTCPQFLRKSELYASLLADYPEANIVWDPALSKSS